MKKKWLALVLSVVMVFGLTACGSTESTDSGKAVDKGSSDKVATNDTGKVLNIWVWNDEFQSRFENYMPGYDKASKTLDGVAVKFVQTPNKDNVYQTKLDEALKAQETASADNKIDIFLMEIDYVDKYINTDYPLTVQSLGVTDESMANMYQYTKDAATNDAGELKAVTWQGCPGGFIYRRSYAKKVFGTDDPAKIQEQIADWDKFEAAAAKVKEKTGGKMTMLSGFDDTYRVFSSARSAPWVDSSKTVVMDPAMQQWVDQTKKFTENGYNQKTSLWADEWSAGMKKDGNVFGYFMPSWGISFSLKDGSLEDAAIGTKTPEEIAASPKKGSYGDWAVVNGPQSFNWGGSFIAGCKGTDNTTLVQKVLTSMTTDKDVLKKITTNDQDFVNSKTANQELIAEGFKSLFLGGQAVTEILDKAASSLECKNLSAFDQGIVENFQGSMKDYFNGTTDYDTALAAFQKTVSSKYPELKVK